MNDSNSSDYLISISPNPASTAITIELPVPSPQFQISISNLSGQEIFSGQITDAKTVLDISSLPPGVYFVRVTTDRTVMVGKFVKQ